MAPGLQASISRLEAAVEDQAHARGGSPRPTHASPVSFVHVQTFTRTPTP